MQIYIWCNESFTIFIYKKFLRENSNADIRTLANPAIAPASLWNRQDIAQFKNNIKKEGSEGILKIGHGETVTVMKINCFIYYLD